LGSLPNFNKKWKKYHKLTLITWIDGKLPENNNWAIPNDDVLSHEGLMMANCHTLTLT
jgi:hypothetical protein